MENALGEAQTIVLLGGTSDIGRAIVDRLVTPATRTIVLAGRRPDEMRVDELEDPALTVATARFDATDVAGHDAFVRRLVADHGDLDIVIVAFGELVDQRELDDDPERAAALVTVNYTGAVSVSLAVAAQFRRQGHGRLVVLSSVAGERVRKANFVYGSSKAGLDGFAQGLGDSLAGSGASVLVVRPGFVHSQMTEGMDAGAVRHHAGQGRRGHGPGVAQGIADGVGALDVASRLQCVPPPPGRRVAAPAAGLTPPSRLRRPSAACRRGGRSPLRSAPWPIDRSPRCPTTSCRPCPRSPSSATTWRMG